MKFKKGSIIQTNSRAQGKGFTPGMKGKIIRVLEMGGSGDGTANPKDYLCEIEFADHHQWSGYLHGDEFTLICKGQNGSLCEKCPEKAWCRDI